MITRIKGGKTSSTLFYIIIVLLSSCGKPYLEEEAMKAIGSRDVTTLYSTETWAGIRGDGYWIKILQLQKEDLEDIIARDTTIFTDIRQEWYYIGWQKTPLNSHYNEVKDILSGYYTTDEELEEQMQLVRKLVETEGNFYTFLYKPRLEAVQQVKFVLADTKNGKLYLVEVSV